jgi:hypothetical protein
MLRMKPATYEQYTYPVLMVTGPDAAAPLSDVLTWTRVAAVTVADPAVDVMTIDPALELSTVMCTSSLLVMVVVPALVMVVSVVDSRVSWPDEVIESGWLVKELIALVYTLVSTCTVGVPPAVLAYILTAPEPWGP